MKRNLFHLSLPAAALIGVGAFVGGAGVPAAPNKIDLRPVVAIVDLERATRAFPMQVRVEEELAKLAEEYGTETQRAQEKVRRLEQDLAQWESGTEAHIDAEIKLRLANSELKLVESKFEALYQREALKRKRNVEYRLHARIADFAKAKGYQLVLRTRKQDQGRGQLDSNFVEDVIWAAPELDATEQLIQFLQAGAAKNASAPAPK